MVRHEELFTLEELGRASGRLEANMAPGVDGVSNEILKDVIGAYSEILLEAFNYDDFLCLELPAGTSIIGFADDALFVCAAEDVVTLELTIKESLWRAKRWMDSRGLKMDPEKTEALLVTDR